MMKTELSDKDKKSCESNANIVMLAAIGTTILFTIMQCVFLLMAYQKSSKHLSSIKFDINMIINVILGIFIIIMGNYLPKSKNNGLIGIRTSWSMTNDKTWSYSNHYGGIILVISGFLIIIESLILGGLASIYIELGIIISATIIATIITCEISYLFQF